MCTTISQDPNDSNGRWKIIRINNERYPVRVVERNRRWKIFVTDLVDIWTGTLDREKIFEICERLNPSLSIEDVDLVRLVGNLLNNVDKKVVRASLERLELLDHVEGGIFKFTVDLTPGTSRQLWEQVTRPLCLVSGELQRRRVILSDLVRKKDEEISEYRLNGAELTRKHIRTKIFDGDLFVTKTWNGIAGNALDEFESIMKLRGDIELEKFSINVEPEPYHTEEIQNPETSAKNEEIIKAKVKVKAVENSSLAASIDSAIQPKNEKTDLSKLAKRSNTLIDDNEKVQVPKKARSVPTTRTKISKTTIHDFIS